MNDLRGINGTGRTFSWVIGWLFLSHALADLVVAVYRWHDVDPALTDLLAAALSRSQMCLLAVWLVVGTQRLSWRVSGLVAGICISFIIFSSRALPGRSGLSQQAFWYPEEWLWYFRLSGPGDLLIKAPWLLGGVAVPLVVWRLWLAIRERRKAGLPVAVRFHWPRVQFRLLDAAIWTLTICAALAAIYRTAPYSGWFTQLLEHWVRISCIPNWASVYSITSALPYVLLTLVSLWAVYGGTSLWLRVPLAAAAAIVPAFGFELWLDQTAVHLPAKAAYGIWFRASHETLTSGAAALIMLGSLALVRSYILRCRSLK